MNARPLVAPRRARRSLRGDEGGQLMLLAGIVITIAFLLTSLTLSQVSSLERQAAAEKPTSLADEWRFLHERIGANLESAVPPDLSVSTFKGTTFPIIAATFRNIEAEKGYDTVLRLADSSATYGKGEADLLDAALANYDAVSSDGAYTFALPYDGTSDGVVYDASCPDTDYVGGCIVGVLVFVHITDSTSTMTEVILFPVNTGQ